MMKLFEVISTPEATVVITEQHMKTEQVNQVFHSSKCMTFGKLDLFFKICLQFAPMLVNRTKILFPIKRAPLTTSHQTAAVAQIVKFLYITGKNW